MAAQGRSAQQILEQYFPGAQAADEATGRDWKTFAGDGFVLESLDAADAAYLPELNRARAEASRRSGLNARRPFTVRAFASTPAFREPRWLPAGWPRSLKAIGSERSPCARWLRASFSNRHDAPRVPACAGGAAGGPHAPLWLREGLVEVWSEATARSEMRPRGQPDGHSTRWTLRSRTQQAKPNRQSRIAPPIGTPRSCSRATAAHRYSSGCAQAFPPASLAALGQRQPDRVFAKRTRMYRRRHKRIVAGLFRGRPAALKQHCRPGQQQNPADNRQQICSSQLEDDGPDLMRHGSVRNRR